jgi:RNA polymerase sigma factor (sigma-70 family)
VSAETASGVRGDAVAISRSLEAPEAFTAIFDRHFSAVHRYLARRAGRERADDLASQTFVVAFERRSRYRLDASDARPWLFGIATKLLANDRRSEQRRLESLGRLNGTRRAETSSESASDSERDLAAALARLDPAQRDVLLLHAWCDLPYEGIADALEIPVGTVRSRLSRARVSLQAELDSTPQKQREVS